MRCDFRLFSSTPFFTIFMNFIQDTHPRIFILMTEKMWKLFSRKEKLLTHRVRCQSRKNPPFPGHLRKFSTTSFFFIFSGPKPHSKVFFSKTNFPESSKYPCQKMFEEMLLAKMLEASFSWREKTKNREEKLAIIFSVKPLLREDRFAVKYFSGFRFHNYYSIFFPIETFAREPRVWAS